MYPICSFVSFSFVFAGDLAEMYLLTSILSSTGKSSSVSMTGLVGWPPKMFEKVGIGSMITLGLLSPNKFAVNGVLVVESKLTESTSEVQNVDSGQTVALAALFVRGVLDGLMTNNPRKRLWVS